MGKANSAQPATGTPTQVSWRRRVGQGLDRLLQPVLLSAVLFAVFLVALAVENVAVAGPLQGCPADVSPPSGFFDSAVATLAIRLESFAAGLSLCAFLGIVAGQIILATVFERTAQRMEALRVSGLLFAQLVLLYGIASFDLLTYGCVKLGDGLIAGQRLTLIMRFVSWQCTFAPMLALLGKVSEMPVAAVRRAVIASFLLTLVGNDLFYVHTPGVIGTAGAAVAALCFGISLWYTASFVRAAHQRCRHPFTKSCLAVTGPVLVVYIALFGALVIGTHAGAIDILVTRSLWPIVDVTLRLVFLLQTLVGDFGSVEADLDDALQKVENKRAAAVASNEAKREILRYLFHEIRIPLNSVSLAIEDLQSLLPGEEEPAMVLDIMRSSTSGMSKLLDDFLSFEMVEAGKMQLERESVALSSFLKHTVRAFAIPLTRKSLVTTISIDPRLPDCFIGDPHRLRQCLSNFLSNAVKFTARGGSIVVAAEWVNVTRSVGPLQQPQQSRAGGHPASLGPLQQPQQQLAGPAGVGSPPGEVAIPVALEPGSSGGGGEGGFSVLRRLRRLLMGSGGVHSGGGSSPAEVAAATSSPRHSSIAPEFTSVFAQQTESAAFSAAGGQPIEAAAATMPPGLVASQPHAQGTEAPQCALIDADAFTPIAMRSTGRAEAHAPPPISAPLPQSPPQPHHTAGQASPTAAAAVAAQQPRWLRITVTNEGEGLTPDEQSRLFQPFSQIRPGAQQKSRGTGLGLAITREIVELHGGRVGVRSIKGKTTSFFFEVPVISAPGFPPVQLLQSCVRSSYAGSLATIGGGTIGPAMPRTRSDDRRGSLSQAGGNSLLEPQTHCDGNGSTSGIQGGGGAPDAGGGTGLVRPAPAAVPGPFDTPTAPRRTSSGLLSQGRSGSLEANQPATGAPRPMTQRHAWGPPSAPGEAAAAGFDTAGTMTPTAAADALSALHVDRALQQQQHHNLLTGQSVDDYTGGDCERGVHPGFPSGPGRGAPGGPGSEAPASTALLRKFILGPLPSVAFGQHQPAVDTVTVLSSPTAANVAPSEPSTRLELAYTGHVGHHKTNTCARNDGGSGEGSFAQLTTAIVVDDVASNRILLARLLRRRGVANVLELGGGYAAVAAWAAMNAAEKAALQAVFCDKEMPGDLDGHDTVAHLRANGFAGTILGVTGNALDGDQAAFIAAGADGVVCKPVSVGVLESALAERGLCLAAVAPFAPSAVAATDIATVVDGAGASAAPAPERGKSTLSTLSRV